MNTHAKHPFTSASSYPHQRNPRWWQWRPDQSSCPCPHDSRRSCRCHWSGHLECCHEEWWWWWRGCHSVAFFVCLIVRSFVRLLVRSFVLYKWWKFAFSQFWASAAGRLGRGRSIQYFFGTRTFHRADGAEWGTESYPGLKCAYDAAVVPMGWWSWIITIFWSGWVSCHGKEKCEKAWKKHPFIIKQVLLLHS